MPGEGVEKSKLFFYLRFYIYRATTNTRGSARKVGGLLVAISHLIAFTRANISLFNMGKREYVLILSSGTLALKDDKIIDNKINYYLRDMDGFKVYLADPPEKKSFVRNDAQLLIPNTGAELFCLPLGMFRALFEAHRLWRISDHEKLNIRTRLRLLVKYGVKLSRERYIGLLCKVLGVGKIIVNDGYAHNIEGIYVGNQLGCETVEVQHGIISAGHFGYAEMYDESPEFRPKNIVIWDREAINHIKWSRFANCLLRDHVPSFDFVETEERRILVIGQPSIQQGLMNLYFTLEKKFPGKVFYRAHPREKVPTENVRCTLQISSKDLFVGGFSTLLLEIKQHLSAHVYIYGALLPVGYDRNFEDAGIMRLDSVVELERALLTACPELQQAGVSPSAVFNQ